MADYEFLIRAPGEDHLRVRLIMVDRVVSDIAGTHELPHPLKVLPVQFDRVLVSHESAWPTISKKPYNPASRLWVKVRITAEIEHHEFPHGQFGVFHGVVLL